MSTEFSDLDFIAEGLAPERPSSPDGGEVSSPVIPAAAAESRRRPSVPVRRRKAVSPDADRTAGSRRGVGEAVVRSPSVPRRLYMSSGCYEDIVRLHLLYRLRRGCRISLKDFVYRMVLAGAEGEGVSLDSE